MYAHTHIHIYTHISQHVDPPNINALCMGGGTRCSGRVSVPCFTSELASKYFSLFYRSVHVLYTEKL